MSKRTDRQASGFKEMQSRLFEMHPRLKLEQIYGGSQRVRQSCLFVHSQSSALCADPLDGGLKLVERRATGLQSLVVSRDDKTSLVDMHLYTVGQMIKWLIVLKC